MTTELALHINGHFPGRPGSVSTRISSWFYCS